MNNDEVKPLYDFEGSDVKAEAKAVKDELDYEAIDFRNLMNTKFGFKFVKGLILETGVFAPNRANNSAVYANEGRRSVGLAILEKVKRYTPERVVDLMVFETDLENK